MIFLNRLLELPEKINGLEVKHSPFGLPIEGYDISTYIETCRIFQEVYMHIASARYCLLVANETEHPKICKDEKGYKWFRGLNANTAIMWYNAAFDILLQSLWIYKELYKNHSFSLKKETSLYYDRINVDTLPNILKVCNVDRIKKYVSDKQIGNIIESFQKKHSKIHDLGNSLKHRNSVKYRGVYPKSNRAYTVDYYYEEGSKFQINPNGYNSSDTLILEDLNDIIGKLKDYHISFMEFINEIYVFLGLNELLIKNTIK